MNVAKAIKAQTPEFWHEVGREIKQATMMTFLVCTAENEIATYGYMCPVDAYVLGTKSPRTMMGASKKLPKEARKILSQYFPLHG
jgi:hypothetical protein